MRHAVLLLVVAVVGCDRGKPAPGGASAGTAAIHQETAQQIQPPRLTDDEQELFGIGIAQKQLREKNYVKETLAEENLRVLGKAEQDRILAIRSLLKVWPAKEMTAEQRSLIIAEPDYFSSADLFAYRISIAEQDGGKVLSRLMPLDVVGRLLFQHEYGSENPEKRAQIRLSLEKAIKSGTRSLSDQERDTVRFYGKYLAKLPL